MKQANTSSQAGFSLVELLLAIAVFGFLATAVIGTLVYGRISTAGSGDRLRANALAEEGVEAVRNIRDAGFANLADGTYGLTQSGGSWTFLGSSDATDIFTRSVTISSDGLSRKNVTGSVSWSGVQGSGAASVTTKLSNWQAALTKSWTNPSQYASLDVTGSIAGSKVATSGSYAYMIRRSATGPNFLVINIATPTAPTVVGSLTLSGTPTNVAVSGGYAYVSSAQDTTELQVVRVSTPTAPVLAGSYNAAGNADANGVYISGNYLSLTRSANGGNDEFVLLNISTPTAPTRAAGYSSNINMYESFIDGSYAYITTSSDTAEVIVLNFGLLALLAQASSFDLTGTVDATTIDGKAGLVVVGQGTSLYTLTAGPLLVTPFILGSVTLPGTINDVTYDTTHNYAMAGTSFANGEFQVVNVNSVTSPSILSSVNLSGSLLLTGVAYNPTYDVVAGATSSTAMESVVLGPN